MTDTPTTRHPDTPTTRPTADTDQPAAPDPARGDSDRYRRGLELMDAVQGPAAAQAIRDGFAAISPDFGEMGNYEERIQSDATRTHEASTA